MLFNEEHFELEFRLPNSGLGSRRKVNVLIQSDLDCNYALVRQLTEPGCFVESMFACGCEMSPSSDDI